MVSMLLPFANARNVVTRAMCPAVCNVGDAVAAAASTAGEPAAAASSAGKSAAATAATAAGSSSAEVPTAANSFSVRRCGCDELLLLDAGELGLQG